MVGNQSLCPHALFPATLPARRFFHPGRHQFCRRSAGFPAPAQTWHGASEALIAKPDNPWITPSEKTGLTDSPNYDDTIAWLKKLCAATPLVKMMDSAGLRRVVSSMS